MLSYDRRGHSRSEPPATQGSFDEDGFDYITDPSNWPDYGTELHSGHRAE